MQLSGQDQSRSFHLWTGSDVSYFTRLLCSVTIPVCCILNFLPPISRPCPRPQFHGPKSFLPEPGYEIHLVNHSDHAISTYTLDDLSLTFTWPRLALRHQSMQSTNLSQPLEHPTMICRCCSHISASQPSTSGSEQDLPLSFVASSPSQPPRRHSSAIHNPFFLQLSSPNDSATGIVDPASSAQCEWLPESPVMESRNPAAINSGSIMCQCDWEHFDLLTWKIIDSCSFSSRMKAPMSSKPWFLPTHNDHTALRKYLSQSWQQSCDSNLSKRLLSGSLKLIVTSQRSVKSRVRGDSMLPMMIPATLSDGHWLWRYAFPVLLSTSHWIIW